MKHVTRAAAALIAAVMIASLAGAAVPVEAQAPCGDGEVFVWINYLSAGFCLDLADPQVVNWGRVCQGDPALCEGLRSTLAGALDASQAAEEGQAEPAATATSEGTVEEMVQGIQDAYAALQEYCGRVPAACRAAAEMLNSAATTEAVELSCDGSQVFRFQASWPDLERDSVATCGLDVGRDGHVVWVYVPGPSCAAYGSNGERAEGANVEAVLCWPGQNLARLSASQIQELLRAEDGTVVTLTVPSMGAVGADEVYSPLVVAR